MFFPILIFDLIFDLLSLMSNKPIANYDLEYFTEEYQMMILF